ncbi:unannotated protein [freshwater metagenome]|uniref:Unannotated protein n=1 Tax=freshwater metagenome TaxID=449393 RepID=A0A6J7NP20_9ZZZZ
MPFGSRWFIESFQAINCATDSSIAAISSAGGFFAWKFPTAETANVSLLNPAVWPPMTAWSMPPARPSYRRPKRSTRKL